MKKLTLPNESPSYVPKGIYALPIEERAKAFNQMIEDLPKEDPELIEYKMKALQEMGGSYGINTDYTDKLSECLTYVINTICKRAFYEGYDFTVDDIKYLQECNSLLGISTPDSIEEGF